MMENFTSILLLQFLLYPLLSQDISIGKEFSINSKTLKEDRKYAVFTPDNYQQNPNEAYPVLYILDGHEYFWLAAATIRYLANRGYMPQTIVVGIYNFRNRERDLAPSKGEYTPNGGGAEKFLSFLKEELMPQIDKNYRTQNHKTIYGASLGGLFAMWTLYNYPDVFDNYIAISPSLFHNKGEVFNQGVQYFNNTTSKNKYVFLSLADESWTEMRVHFNNTVSLFKTKATEQNIRWNYKYYNSETHGTTKLVGLNDGLRNLHEHWFVPFYQRNRGIVGIKEHYELLNKTYKYPIEISEKTVNRIAYNLMREGKNEKAKDCFTYNVKNSPNSPNVYDSLGDYYKSIENWAEAEKSYKQAIETAKRLNKKTDYYEKNLKQIRELKSQKKSNKR